MRPCERSTNGTKDAAPEINKKHWITSLKAVSSKERGKITAANTRAANNPTTAANQNWECLFRTVPRIHSRWDWRRLMVTVVISNKRVEENVPVSPLLVSFFYSIICPEAATPVETQAIE